MRMGPRQAEAMVTAFLGRPPQDEMEAAVVLESWGGVSSPHALHTASQMAYPPGPPPPLKRQRLRIANLDFEGAVTMTESLSTLAFVLALFVLAAIGGAGGTGGSPDAVDAWRPAVPVTLGLTWLLRRRYGAGRTAMGLLRRDSPVVLGLTALVIVPMLLLLPGMAGMVGAFIVLGVGGAVTVLRGWGPLGVVAVAGVAVVSVPLRMAVPTTFATAAVVVALVGAVGILSAPGSRLRARPWHRAIPAGVAGTTTGVLITLVSSEAGSTSIWVVGLALAPSLVASMVGGLRLARFWVVVPAALAAVSVTRLGAATEPRLVAQRLVGGAGVLAVLALVVLSVLAQAVAAVAGATTEMAPLLVGFGVAAAVALTVTLLEAFARPWWGVATAAGACTLFVGSTELVDLSSLVAAAITCAALLIAVGPLTGLLRRPEQTVATLV